MQRRIVVRINGDFEPVLRVTPCLEVKRHEDCADVVLASRIELAAMKEAAAHFAVELVPFFQAFDFTAEDLKHAPMLAIHVFGGPVIEMPPLVERQRCRTCDERIEVVRAVDHVDATTDDAVTGALLAAGDENLGGVLAHRDFLRSLSATRHLTTTPVTINGTNEDYVLVRGGYNLGRFVGDVKYGPPCAACGRPELLDNENFLEIYEPPTEAVDFARSAVHGALSLFISQAVYRHIVERVPDRSTLVLSPIELGAATS